MLYKNRIACSFFLTKTRNFGTIYGYEADYSQKHLYSLVVVPCHIKRQDSGILRFYTFCSDSAKPVARQAFFFDLKCCYNDF